MNINDQWLEDAVVELRELQAAWDVARAEGDALYQQLEAKRAVESAYRRRLDVLRSEVTRRFLAICT